MHLMHPFVFVSEVLFRRLRPWDALLLTACPLFVMAGGGPLRNADVGMPLFRVLVKFYCCCSMFRRAALLRS